MYFQKTAFLNLLFVATLLYPAFLFSQALPAVSINNNSKYSNAKDSKVALFLNMTKAKEMMISNDDGFGDASWEGYSNTKDWNLTKSEGVKTVFVKFKDQTNRESTVFRASIILDITPPKPLSITINNNSKFANNPLKQVNIFVKAEDASQMRLSNSADFIGARWNNYADTVKNWTLSGNDGEKVVYVQFKDQAGNLSEVIKDDILLDRIPPSELSLKINDGNTLTNRVKVKLKISATGAYEMIFKKSGASWISFQTDIADFELEGSDGIQSVTLRFRDEAGNVSAPVSSQIKIDRKAPQGGKMVLDNNASFTSNPDKKVAIKLYAVEATEMIIGEDSSFKNETWQSYKPTSTIILSGEDGRKKVFVKFRDLAGNESEIIDDEIVLDRSKPEIGSIVIEKGSKVTNKTLVALALQSPEAKQIILSVNPTFTGSVWEKFEPSKSLQLQGADGEKTIFVKFKDAAGNVSEVQSVSITLDRKPPASTRIKIDNGAAFSTDKAGKVALTLEAEEAAEMLVSNTNDFKGAQWQKFQSVLDWTLTGEDGIKVVGAKFKDAAGNESSVVTAKIKLARSASVSGGFVINGDSLITKNPYKRVDLSLKAQGAKEMMIGNSIDFNDGVWEDYKPEKVWTLSEGDGEKTVYVKFRGFVGNESKVYTDRINLDRGAPSNGKIAINNDSLFTVNKKNQVKLYIQAEGATHMMVSNNPVFQGASWEPFKTMKPWQLDSEDGIKNVYVKFKDEIGNISEVASDRILLDKTPPKNVSIKINNDAAFSNNPKKAVTLVFAHDDATLMRISNTPDVEGSKWEKADNKKLNWILPGEDGEKRVYAQYMDDGKNMSPVVFDKIILDRKPPANCSFTINNDSLYTNNKDSDVRIYMKGEEAKSVLISNTKDFFGARWEAFKAVKEHWILDGPDGEKIVYMLFRDEAENIFPDTVSHKIILDKTPPSNISVSLKEGNIDGRASAITINIKASDASMMEVRTQEDVEGKWEAYSETKTIDVTEGVKNIWIRLKDQAGNVSDLTPALKPQ